MQGIEALPVVPQALELVGIFFSSWFVYRYLLFKPDRRVSRAEREQTLRSAARDPVAHATVASREELKTLLGELKAKILK
jgi:predicted DNA-binding transcriptional regulator